MNDGETHKASSISEKKKLIRIMEYIMEEMPSDEKWEK